MSELQEEGPWEFGNCSRCKEEGVTLYGEICVDCANAEPIEREIVLGVMGAAPRLARLSFDSDRSPSIAAALDRLSTWWVDPGEEWSVTLIGPTGTGKSALATELYYRWYGWHVRRNYPWEVPCHGAFIRARQVVDAALSRDPEAEERTADLARWRRLPFLIVDEYGAGHAAGPATDPIVDLCSRRYDRDLVTVFTTNLPSVEALEALSPQLADRMRSGIILPIKGDSLRGGESLR